MATRRSTHHQHSQQHSGLNVSSIQPSISAASTPSLAANAVDTLSMVTIASNPLVPASAALHAPRPYSMANHHTIVFYFPRLYLLMVLPSGLERAEKRVAELSAELVGVTADTVAQHMEGALGSCQSTDCRSGTLSAHRLPL